MLLVGRTGPRGGDAYNEKLGQSRAEAVTQYLKNQGVKKARVETASTGAQGASSGSGGVAAGPPGHHPAGRRLSGSSC